ncbi:MAG: LysR family transcriptional regulator [Sorangiineae bacterium]|nr:LysR family transcriptional regulator [Polyangiaceae bacterium]MEB2324645.1 LysR family transcriptional regulator [Sorangiineae bacterium]
MNSLAKAGRALPPSPLSSERLRVFVVVVRRGGFSAAARALGVTQPSVSQSVAQLERELGAALLVREGRAVHLTEAGRLFLPLAERVLDEGEAARAALAELGELETGRLVVGTTDTFALYLLPAALRAFRERYPGVELRLDTAPSPAIAARVASREVDVGVVSLPLAGGEAHGLESVRLAALTDVVVAPPAHPLASRRRVRLDALAGEPLILLDRTTATRAHLEAGFATLPEAPRVVMETNSVEVQKKLVELGFGLAILPSLAVAHEVRARRLVAVPLERQGSGRHAGLVWAGAKPRGPASRAFIELARATHAERCD